MFALALWALGGCSLYEGDEPPHGEPELGCEVQGFIDVEVQPTADILFVIDDSTAMTPYQEGLLANMPRFMRVLGDLPGGLPSVHIGVVSSDLDANGGALTGAPQIEGCTPPNGAYILDEATPWWTCGADAGTQCRDRNYEAPLPGTATCISMLGTGGRSIQRPLAAAVKALDGTLAGSVGFLRREAFLLVVVISASDDASPGSELDYAGALEQLKPDPSMVLVSIVASDSASRLVSFANRFPSRKIVVDIDRSEWSDALFLLGLRIDDSFDNVFGCLRGVDDTDVDLDEPGLQLDCVLTRTSRTGEELVVPRCRMAAHNRPDADTTVPCWWTETTLEYGPDCRMIPRMEGGTYETVDYDFRCAGTCE